MAIGVTKRAIFLGYVLYHERPCILRHLLCYLSLSDVSQGKSSSSRVFAETKKTRMGEPLKRKYGLKKTKLKQTTHTRLTPTPKLSSFGLRLKVMWRKAAKTHS